MMLFAAPAYAPTTAASAIILGYFLPLFIFATATGGSLYMMHTHRDIPWFQGEPDEKRDPAAEYCSTHLTLPAPISKLVHHVFSHSVHHAHPGIPCYQVPQAQKRLNELLGERAISEPLSFRRTIETLAACKLYDFEQHQWLDFNGRPTTKPINLRRLATCADRTPEVTSKLD
jgi:omega-6 fatty acid desaturase (delta-12 desaturase)